MRWLLNPFWDNWFVQAGLGMSLINAYGENFMDVFPNGKTFGVNLGFGKWFTPEFGLRVGFNWQNGIIGNNHLVGWISRESLAAITKAVAILPAMRMCC